MTEREVLSILLIDDDQDDYLIVKNLVSKLEDPRYTLEWIQDFDAAIAAIAEENHHIYLIDYKLGPQTGLELLQKFDVATREQPFVILTGAGDKRLEQDALDIGVSDYLVKGQIDELLLSRVLKYSVQRKAMELQRIRGLQEVNASKDEFIALASHQLRTPATAVKQYLGMLLDGYAGQLEANQESLLSKAYQSNERQLRTVDDILRVAQLDLDQIRLETKTVSLYSLLEQIAQNMDPILRAKRQKMMIESETDAQLMADSNYLEMALSNIIDNASKYSDEQSEIQLSAVTTADAVEICIRDHGVGISTEDMSKLFLKFSRIDNPLSISAGGNGLGLYWTKKVIELHKGTITVESKVSAGTSFLISLPINFD